MTADVVGDYAMLTFLVVAAALITVDSAMESRDVFVAEGRPLLLDCSENMTSFENTTFTWKDNAELTKYFRYWQESTRSLAGNYTCKARGMEAVVFIVTVEYLDNMKLDLTPSDTCNVNNVTATCAVDSNVMTNLTIHREDTDETYISEGQNLSRQFEVQCGQTVRVRCTATSGKTSRVQFRQLDVLCAPDPPDPSLTVDNVMNVTFYANPAPVYTWTRTTTMYSVNVSNVCGSSKFNLHPIDAQGGKLDVGESIAIGATGCLVLVAIVVIATYGVRRLYRRYKEGRAMAKLKALSATRGVPIQAASSVTGDTYEEIGTSKQAVERVEYDLVDEGFSGRHSQTGKQSKRQSRTQKRHLSGQSKEDTGFSGRHSQTGKQSKRQSRTQKRHLSGQSKEDTDHLAPERVPNTYEDVLTRSVYISNQRRAGGGGGESVVTSTRRANVPEATYEEPVTTVKASAQPDTVYEELQEAIEGDGTGSHRAKYEEAERGSTDLPPESSTRRANVPEATYEEPVTTVKASAQPDTVYEELQEAIEEDSTGSHRAKYEEAERGSTDLPPESREVKPPVPSRKNRRKSTRSVSQSPVDPEHQVPSEDTTHLPTVPPRHPVPSEGNTYEELTSDHRPQRSYDEQSDSRRHSDTDSGSSGYEMPPDDNTLRKLRQRAQKHEQKREQIDSQPKRKRLLAGWRTKKARGKSRKQAGDKAAVSTRVRGDREQDGQGCRRSNVKRYRKDEDSTKAGDDAEYMNQDGGDATRPAYMNMLNIDHLTQTYEDMATDVKSSRSGGKSPTREYGDQRHFQKALEVSEAGFYDNIESSQD